MKLHTIGLYTEYKEATTSEVSDKTGKSRPTESDYFNQLCTRSLIIKRKEGKLALFKCKEELVEEEEEKIKLVIQ